MMGAIRERRIGVPLLATALLAGGSVAVQGQEKPQSVARTDRSTVSLISDHGTVSAGTSFWVGLHFELAPGWHTYWQNPGDAGNPTNLEWQLPDGVVAGAIRWPLPERIPSGPLMSFGYEDEVVLLTRVSAFKVPSPGDALTVRARATWLVCADICVPESAYLTLEIPISDAPRQATERSAARIKRFAARLPGPTPPGVTFQRSGDKIELSAPITVSSADAVDDVWFFPDHYGQVDHRAPQPWLIAGGDLRLELTQGEIPLIPSAPLEGTIVVRYEDGSETGWRVIATPETTE